MSMQLRIVHTTRYDYDGRAVASYNQARLTPVTTPEQIVVHSRLEVSPKPWTSEYRDYFGTQVTAFEVVDPHDTMTVTATSTVQVNRPPNRDASASWDDVTAVADRWTEYLMLPELVTPPDDFAQRCKEIAATHERPGQAARSIAALVADEVEYLPGTTDSRTPAARAWQQRAGVCQDMVHLLIGGLRSIGIPTRYVSGYNHPSLDPVVGETVVGGSHAWAEWWDDGWHPFDLTNGTEPNDRYVVVATGRDYDDVKPLAGIYSGARTSALYVDVSVTRLA